MQTAGNVTAWTRLSMVHVLATMVSRVTRLTRHAHGASVSIMHVPSQRTTATLSTRRAVTTDLAGIRASATSAGMAMAKRARTSTSVPVILASTALSAQIPDANPAATRKALSASLNVCRSAVSRAPALQALRTECAVLGGTKKLHCTRRCTRIAARLLWVVVVTSTSTSVYRRRARMVLDARTQGQRLGQASQLQPMRSHAHVLQGGQMVLARTHLSATSKISARCSKGAPAILT